LAIAPRSRDGEATATVLDGHIHLAAGESDPEGLAESLRAAGIDGGALISRSPASFAGPSEALSAAARLEGLLEWTRERPQLAPLFWIDPMEAGAGAQVAAAVRRGAAGFKVIPSRHAVGAPAAMEVYRAIAEAGRPILFHCGILWDGRPSSARCRPAEFEALLDVPGLRFALAHAGWPWCDELIAVYGKFQMARRTRPDLDVEMFVDTTPGTPPIYRREVLRRLFTVGYDVEDNVFFGTDGVAPGYDVEWAREWIERDRGILADLGLDDAVIEKVFAGNLRRFLGRQQTGCPGLPGGAAPRTTEPET
jgi:predicted TIM-barrel fold metal-dependent hydrolase